ncbi:MAG: hypothetical protein IKJ77_02430 [Firmicutes bacterium]|nr:hypothetical protein [Bacillota bacterium]
MNRDYVMLQYRLIRMPLLVSFAGFALLMVLGLEGLPYAAIGGWLCFLWAADKLMGKSLVGDDAVMMHLLPLSAKTQVITKVLLTGFWVSVICSIPAFLMMRNGGQYIDSEVMGMEGGLSGMSLFYRGLPHYRYAIDTCPSVMDTAVSDLIDDGTGIAQASVMAMLIPAMLFLIGCFFAVIVLMTQLYLHPLLKKLPTVVVTFLGMVLATLLAGGILFVTYLLISMKYVGLFTGELLLFALFGVIVCQLVRVASKNLNGHYDIAA